MTKPQKKTLDDLSAADFPGIDPDQFFAWWKERVILDEERKPNPLSSGMQFQLDYWLFRRLTTFPQFLRCRSMQKKAGITSEMIKSALAKPKTPKP